MKTSFILLILFFTISVSAQDARSYLRSALSSYGPWENVKTFSYELEGSRNAGAQGKTFNSGEKQLYYNKKVFDYKNKTALEQNRNVFPGGYNFNFHNLVQDTVIYNWDIDQNRTGKILNRGNASQAKQLYNFRDIQIAYYRIKELANSEDSLILRNETDDSVRIERFRKNRPAIIYTFDKGKRLVSVEATASKEKQTFTDYKVDRSFVNAATIRQYNNGELVSEEKVRDWKYDFKADPAMFRIPAGYVETPKGTPSVTEIAKDVFLIDKIAGDRNVLFVNMDEFIVVIEAPLSATVSKDVVARIRKTIPGKQIKYVFTTHFHSDHTGGLREYAAEGVTLLMAEETSHYVNELMNSIQQDDLAKSGMTAVIKTFKEKFELEDANHHIIFYEVPNSHADGMSLVYLPREKIIYQGDLLSVPLDGTLPYSIDVHRELDAFIKENKLDFVRMVGHHGSGYITPVMLQQVLNIRRNVKY